MYAISKRQREEVLFLLTVLREQRAGDARAANNRRRAGILIRKLQKAREIGFDDVRKSVSLISNNSKK